MAASALAEKPGILASEGVGLLAGAGWSLAGAVVNRGVNVLVLMICARALTQTRFGELAMVLGTVGMFGPVAGLGLGMTCTRYLAEYRRTDPGKAGRILALSLLAGFAAGALMTVLFIALAPVIAARTLASPHLAHSLAVSSGMLFFGVIEVVQTGALTGLEAFSQIARLSLWNGILSLPFAAWLVYRFGVDGALAGMTISLALNCLLNGVVLRRESRRFGIQPAFRRCWSERPVLLAFSLPSYLAGIIVTPASWGAAALLVNRPNGYEEMALFSAADRWRCLLIFAPLAASRIAVPVFSRLHASGDRAGYLQIYRANLAMSAILAVVPAVVCALLAAPLMGFYGRSFLRGWPVLVILALSAIPTVFNTQLGSVLLSRGLAWTRMAIDFILAALFLGFAWWAIPRWDAVGLAGAFAAAYSIATAILWLLVRQIHGKA